MLSPEEIFHKFQKTITDKCVNCCSHYFESNTYRKFKARCALIDAAIDGKFANQNSYIADVSPMLIRQDYNSTTAFLWKYFENDPIITLKSLGGSSQQNADIMQNVLQSNFTVTRFREKTLLPIFDNLSRYGTAAAFTQFEGNYNAGGDMSVFAGPDSTSPYPIITDETGKKVAVTKSVHPLNVFMDPGANFQSESEYIGFLDSWFVSELFLLKNDDIYNQKNLEDAIESSKKGMSDGFWYGSRESEMNDYSRGKIHPIRMWTTLNFDGNEDDTTIYYCELVHNKLIRCHPAGVVKDKVPLQVGTYYPRNDMWMGNSNLEFKMSFQNLKNWLIGATIEGTMKAMDRMVLVRRGGGIDVADINARHQMGGIVYYDGMEEPSELMYPVQFQNAAKTDVDWLNREVNQMVQELSPVVNMQNKYNEGGLNNKTLGAAQMQAGIGEVLFGFVMKNVSFFISRIGAVSTREIQENVGDLIPFRENPYQNEELISRAAILGEFEFSTESSYYINEKGERVDSANMITQSVNWKATKNPEFEQLNITEMLRDWVKAWKGSGTDIDKYLNKEQAIRQPASPNPGAAGNQPPGGLDEPPTQQPITGAI